MILRHYHDMARYPLGRRKTESGGAVHAYTDPTRRAHVYAQICTPVDAHACSQAYAQIRAHVCTHRLARIDLDSSLKVGSRLDSAN